MIADQFLTEPVHVVGHSYGAIVAMMAAASRPASVKSLTLIEPPATRVARGNPVVDEWAARLDGMFAEPGDDLSALLARFFELQGVLAPVPQLLPEPLERGARALVGARPATEAELPMGAVAAAGLPCLVVSGGHHDGYEAVCDVIADQTDAQRAVIRSAAHLVAETGDLFNRRLEEFLLESER